MVDGGKVYLVGAGPGDPDLITQKGLRCLQKAEVVIYDHLVNPRLLEETQKGAELVYVGKKAGRHARAQAQINRLLVQKAEEGRVVVRLKGGDPFVFGRGGEEALALAESKIPFEIVPGITAATAVPAYAGIPVTHRGFTSTLLMVTGHEDPNKESSDIDWQKISTGAGTLTFFMGVHNLRLIVRKLLDCGRSPQTPVALIRWGTEPSQQTLTGTLEGIVQRAQKAQFRPPAIIIVGEVVRLREKLNWFESKPLFGKRIVVTRSRAQASTLSHGLRELGAEVLEFPTVKIVPPDDFRPLDVSIDHMDTYDWIVFTSVNGVNALLNRTLERGKDVRDLKGPKICAIGPATRQGIESLLLKVDLQPEKFVAEEIVERLSRTDNLDRKMILLPRADQARSYLPHALRNHGARVDDVVAYKTVQESGQKEEVLEQLRDHQIDWITFTSSSTVRNFHQIVGQDNFARLKGRFKTATIGPVTSETLREFGAEPTVEAEEYTVPGLVKAIAAYHENVNAVP